MRRREFMTLLGRAAAVWPLGARAEQTDQMRRVGFLMDQTASDPEGQARIAAFQQTLQQLGWTDGRNVGVDIRWTDDSPDRTSINAAELIGLTPDVIVVAGNSLLGELQRLTKTIPIVFTTVSGPIESGFIANLARPGANITGFQNFEPAIMGKFLQLLKETAPSVGRAAVLLHPNTAVHIALFNAAEALGPSLGIQVVPVGAQDGSQIERGIASFATNADGSLIVLPHLITIQNRNLIIEQAARYRLPAIYFFRYYAVDGGLISYGPDQVDQFRRAAGYVDRILKGEKPADLPVQAPTKYELVVNIKTAKALGLEIPPSLLVRADEVIE
jgi:putative tryptophan/tyrosine transport system substrate-binding protein